MPIESVSCVRRACVGVSDVDPVREFITRMRGGDAEINGRMRFIIAYILTVRSRNQSRLTSRLQQSGIAFLAYTLSLQNRQCL